MKLLLYSQIFTLTKSPIEYANIEKFGAKTYFDTLLFMQAGERWLAPVIVNLLNYDGERYFISDSNLTLLGQIIDTKFLDSWNKIYDTLNIEYNPISDYRMSGNETVIGSGSTESADNKSVINRITSYDTAEDSYIDSTKDTSNTVYNQSNQNTNNTTFDKEGITGKTPVQSYIRNEIDLRKTTCRDIIVKDLISFTTLDLY